MTPRTVIESLGVYLPPKVVTTDEVLRGCRSEVAFPLERFTGIRSRRMADGEFAFDLAARAIEDCLARSRRTAADVDLLICSTISKVEGPGLRVVYEPTEALRLARRFGIERAIAFDIQNACAGMFTAIAIADAFLKTGAARCALVASGEYTTHLVPTAQKEIEDFLDPRLACLTVGDAGAALLLELSPDERAGFQDIDLYTLGRHSDCCTAGPTDREHGGAIMLTDSVRIAAVGIPDGARHALAVLRRNGWDPKSLQHIIMHQASRTTILDAAREINSLFRGRMCHDGNIVVNLAERGNTGSTTHFVALSDGILAGRIRTGDRVFFSASGSGLTLGTALYTLDDLPGRLAAGVAPPRTSAAPAPHARPAAPAMTVAFESVGVAPPGSARRTFDLAAAAVDDCLSRSSLALEDVELLIFAGVYRSGFIAEPALAAMIAGRLEINDAAPWNAGKKTFAFDVSAGANGFLAACHVAARMIEGGRFRTAMVLAAEVENNADARPGDLRGLEETGSAAILRAARDGEPGFRAWLFEDDARALDAFESAVHQSGALTTLRFRRDPALEDLLLDHAARAAAALLDRERVDPARLKLVLPPQISPDFTAKLCARLGFPREKFVDATRGRRDLFTSSLPWALDLVRREGLAARGDLLLLIGAGTGIQVGAALYEL